MELKELFEKSTFAEKKSGQSRRHSPEWGSIKIDEDGYVHVPECSYLGDTLICLSHPYEGSGDDCLFVQELIRAYIEGRLKEVNNES